MKRFFIIITVVFLQLPVTAQENKIGISFFQNYSTFRFIDSGGEKGDMSFALKSGYGIYYRKNFDKPLFLEGGISYNNKGAASSIDLTRLDWSFHYLNADLTLGYMITIGKLSPHVAAGLYYGRLIKAEQIIGSSFYDLMDLEVINKNDMGIRVSGGIEYLYSASGSIFLRINESAGLAQLEKGDSGQLMYNRTFSVQIGLFFNINSD